MLLLARKFLFKRVVTMSDLNNLSATELKELIGNAEKALSNIKANDRKKVIAQIKELAASIDAEVSIKEDKKPVRSGAKVAIKYRDPANAENTWTGRGVMPRWLKAYLDSGRQRSEFEV